MLEPGIRSKKLAQLLVAAVVLLWVLLGLAPAARAQIGPAQGPGGPILVLTSGSPSFGTYYAEILRTEGFNAFAVADISTATPAMLATYDVVLLAKMALSGEQVTTLTDWVNGGGNLIAMAPDPQLAGLLGVTPLGTTLSDAYLLVNTSGAPGNGIVGQTIQYHGAADLYTLNGAAPVATLYSTANTATGNPAVTLRAAGSGNAAAFAYDLAESIVYTRQGNPVWAAQERDGLAPIRSDDKFYGNKVGDVRPDWVDLDKVAIPQADEQQRLLANLILHMNAGKKPLPRFWYFPNGKKAVVIMTGDDHGNNGTFGRFEQFRSLSPAGCSVANWECVRGTSYVFASTRFADPPLTDAQVAGFVAEGFEVGVHINTGCGDFTRGSLQEIYDAQVPEFQAAFPSAGPLRTQRHHCIAWSDWSSGAEVQLSKGMRLDTSYYYWPPSWVNGVPGMFTGSAMPMRFTKLNGEFIDVYMTATQMTDESGQAYPYTVDTLLDRALGAEGYYGAYTVNAHTDVATIVESDTVVTSALARGVPIVSAQQMLTWLDARNASSFGAIGFAAGTLTFTVTRDPAANGLQAMLPARHGTKVLSTVLLGSSPVGFTVTAIKGVEYAFFTAFGGTYTATYADDTTAPQVVSTSPAAGATGISVTARPSATFGEAMDASTVNPTTFELRNAAGSVVSATVLYDGATRTATLVPASPLAASEAFTATLRGGASAPQVKDLAGNALTSGLSWSFTTASGPVCPCGGWDPTATPANPSVADPNAVELGVRFTSDVSGFVTGVRFYKGSGNTGTHVGNLWSSTGALLATATFTAETGSGWQEVSFANAVPIAANTVYVASYFAPNGNYAADAQFFANSSVYKAPIRLLQDGAGGGNGVYAYGSASSFPSSTYRATNYWVDVVFSTVGPADNTPPTVTASTPTSGAVGVGVTTSVSVTFSEAVDAATVTSSTLQLRTLANALVPATVSYNAATRTATLTPTSPLAESASFTATVVGGDTDPRIKDVAGNALVSSFVLTFTTATASSCPCGAWGPSNTPTNPSVADSTPVELGVKFTSDVNGFVTGIRFYKGAGNTGTHIGNLWTSAGVQLASATFTGETESGWQEVTFANPVAITANTVYVASYFAPNGRYAGDYQFFAANSVYNPPIRLLQNGVSGGNGVYTYGATSSFPSSTYQSTNYWVDVVFNTVGPADNTPPTVTSTVPANGATGVAMGSTVSITFSEALDPATVSSGTVSLVGPGSSAVAGTVSYNAATRTATFIPTNPLAASTSYTATIRGGGTDPRIKDAAGNALAANVTLSFTTGGVGGSCGTPANAIVAENCLAGSPASEWDISGVGDPSIQGFATDISVNRGGTVSFKVSSATANYRFDIYRMGYYGGLGARKITTFTPASPQSQPSCLNDAATGLIDCGNWSVSGSWTVPATAVSGIYFAKVIRSDTGGASHIFFVVRDDAGTSDLLFQTSDTTWQAYNNYGGNSLYAGQPAGRAYKVSYNRPFYTRGVDNGQDWVFNAEYPMVRWLEANGYNVSYFSGVDTDRFGGLITRHKTFVSVGHDEYWSGNQRANVEAARNAGVNLAFFSGNEVFWKTRWENSIDSSGTPYRTLVSYKETHANAKIDPSATWTGTWRDPRFSPPADGGRPENALTGTIFQVNGGTTSIVVPEADGKMRFWRNTSIANLTVGAAATLPNGTLGYEWDTDEDNGFRPAGLIRLSSTTATGVEVLLDYGSSYGSGTANHALTLYRHASGARVFGAGTIQWSWGLDATHDRAGTPVDARMQQATVNLFADMGVQPATLQAGLVPATASTDAIAPSSTITSPAQSANVPTGSSITITGSASDTGGGVVGGVEVSVDGGVTWRRANGRASWTFNWTPTATGTVNIKSRAADDSGNLEVPSAGVSVNVAAQTCPCTIWPAAAAPAVVSDNDPAAVTIGTKFRSDQNGYITAIRFYKGPNNTGTHVGALWTASGQQLATVTFGNETASGWQQANFSTPVAITANTVYVVGYHAPNGQYSGDDDYFQLTGVNNPPLHALRNGESGANGVYIYGSAIAFPTQTYRSENYWVDVVFTTAGAPGDTTPPTVTTTTPTGGATGVAINSAVTATFSEPMNAGTISGGTFLLRNPAGTAITSTVSYNAGTSVATLTPSAALAASTSYTAVVLGGSSGVKDTAGNPMASDRTWSFTTSAPADTTPPTVSTVTPVDGATNVGVNSAVTVAFSESMNAASITTATFVLRNPAGTAITSTVSYNTATNVATLIPSAVLAGLTTYTATVLSGSSGVKDAAGNAMAANRVWTFTTASTDTTPPTVSTISPTNGATGISTVAPVTATFSEAMDASTIGLSTFELRIGTGAPLEASVAYNATTRVATLTPTIALAPSTVYTATVKGGATEPRVKDLAGNALSANRVWSFTTIAAPTVTPTSPAAGATGVSPTTNVTATFSRAMNAATINSSTVELRDPSNAVVPSVVSYNSTSRVVTLNPTPNLIGGWVYTAIVRGGASGVKDSTGNALTADRVWTFTIENTPPTVTAISPASGATGVSRTANATATFSEAMDASTISTSTVELRNASNNLIAAAVSYSTSTRVVTLNPTSTLPANANYTVTIKGGTTDPRVKDVAGNALATSRVWTFRTGN